MNTLSSAPRRSFIQLAGGLSAASAAGPWLSAMGASASATSSTSTTSPVSLTSAADSTAFAYVGTYTRDAPGGTAGGPPSAGIHVFAMRAQGWRLVQVMESDNPSYLAVHPTRRFLYAINEIEHWQGLPRGTAEAYAIEGDGSLRLLNRQPLSLSSTAPAHLAVSPDGKHLVTAQYLGGTYNVLPINRDGSLGAVSGIVKETGSGPRPEQQSAHPHMVLFDPTGQRVLATDLGSDRINAFTLEDGNLSLSGRTELPPGSGPRHLALHPDGALLYVVNELDASVACYGYDVIAGRVLEPRHTVPATPAGFTGTGNAASLLIHPSGRFLYVSTRRVQNDHPQADSIGVFGIGADGALAPLQVWTEGLRFPRALTMAPDGGALYALNQKGDSILRLRIDAATGRLENPDVVAQVPTPVCLVFA
ncbi:MULTISPECIES: lactonase family protein [Achromobacter]|uniref:Beta-propeller fold lactonase family protein n=1 Tax=Achromobacter spanius TaxID=217203 RepID=A0ABY8H031_9BURK|nr:MULTISPECIES: beta-propeller fold lactonase family protein [Achromobacter]WAI86098.1 beta-propeller fold lactonase family protein [Achromobacter spanius]WEX96179.1 beta-propeller fold lactonase family protein [Achromobacter sp. SS2-2022]WFP10103.1 beta-propeller fold lactonase family protein [Achromobacter spanius]